jgi:hypothetical protein
MPVRCDLVKEREARHGTARVPAAHDDMLGALPEWTMRLLFFKPRRSARLVMKLFRSPTTFVTIASRPHAPCSFHGLSSSVKATLIVTCQWAT